MSWASKKAREAIHIKGAVTEADFLQLINEIIEECRQWVGAEARDCACSTRIEAHLRRLLADEPGKEMP